MNKLFYFLFEIKIYCDKDFELLFNYLIFFLKKNVLNLNYIPTNQYNTFL